LNSLNNCDLIIIKVCRTRSLDIWIIMRNELQSRHNFLLKTNPLRNWVVQLCIWKVDKHTSYFWSLHLSYKLFNMFIDSITYKFFFLFLFRIFEFLGHEHLLNFIEVSFGVMDISKLWSRRRSYWHRGYALIHHSLLLSCRNKHLSIWLWGHLLISHHILTHHLRRWSHLMILHLTYKSVWITSILLSMKRHNWIWILEILHWVRSTRWTLVVSAIVNVTRMLLLLSHMRNTTSIHSHHFSWCLWSLTVHRVQGSRSVLLRVVALLI
jgi:hypothetical protein